MMMTTTDGDWEIDKEQMKGTNDDGSITVHSGNYQQVPGKLSIRNIEQGAASSAASPMVDPYQFSINSPEFIPASASSSASPSDYRFY
mmetsp:Transcript_21357/g.18196  ORF Transcript_21357/g.18196 Transcript_21357/m.18196 type:complete len:88 (-) Transcript_21357:61-324(-)